MTLADTGLLDQGKQTELVYVIEWFGLHELLACSRGGGEGPEEMRNSDGVPRETGQKEREETVCVVDGVVDDYFNNIHGKPGGRRPVCRGSLRGEINGTQSLNGALSNVTRN